MSKYDGAIIITTKLDNTDLEKDLENLDKKVVKEVDAIEDSFDSASKGANTFSDNLKANLLSEAVVGGLRGVADKIKDMAGDFIEAAASVKAENSQFEQTFGMLQDSATDAIDRVADESGILETRLNTLGSKIYAFARSSGGDTAESMELMEKALRAAADGAAYYDKSIEDSAETLQSFLKGNYENDAALGLSATETTRNAAAMELFGQKFQDLTEIQKQQTLLQMVLDAQELSGAMGQAAREADGWENVQGNLNESWRQFMASAGAPLLANLVPIIQDITSGLQDWTEKTDWESFSANIDSFVSAIMDNGPTILSLITGIGAGFVAWNVVTMLGNVVGAVKAFQTANEGLKISQIALNAAMNANPIAIVVTLIAGLVAALLTLWNTNEDFRSSVIEVWEDIEEGFGNMRNKIVGGLESAVNAIIYGINWLIKQLNKVSFKLPDWVPAIGGKGFGFNIQTIKEVSFSNIPHLATGAVVPPNREFMAVLGDNKYETEVVSPLSTMKQAMLEALRESGSMGEGGTFTFVVNLDGKVVARNQYKHLRDLEREHGTSLISR